MSKKNKKNKVKNTSSKILKQSVSVKTNVSDTQANAKHALPIKLIKKDLVKTTLFAVFAMGMILVLKKLNLNF